MVHLLADTPYRESPAINTGRRAPTKSVGLCRVRQRPRLPKNAFISPIQCCSQVDYFPGLARDVICKQNKSEMLVRIQLNFRAKAWTTAIVRENPPCGLAVDLPTNSLPVVVERVLVRRSYLAAIRHCGD